MTFLTKVHIHNCKERTYRLLSGNPESFKVIEGREYAIFPEGKLFIYSRWHKNEYGTDIWNIFVAKSASPGSKAIKISGILPAAQLLCFTQGKHYSSKLLKLIRKAEPYQLQDEFEVQRLVQNVNMGLV